jgi:hypothetical protein
MTEREIRKRVRANQARIEREWKQAVKSDKTWLPRFEGYQFDLIDSRPHLVTDHEFCGLFEDEVLDTIGSVDTQLKLGI